MFFKSQHNFRNAYFLASFTVFIILNSFENIIHYNIGRISEDKEEDVQFYYPNHKDLYRIVIIMIIFGILQATLSGIIEKYF